MKKIFAGLVMLVTMALFGCGGNGGTQPATVSGTASQGAALVAGTTVTLKDAKGAKVTTTVGENGAYSIAVDGLAAPFVLDAGGIYSFASVPGTTNINPFTHLSMQLAIGTSTVNDSTVIPATFQDQYASVVSDLKVKIDGLFPSSVTATQKDFLNGKIVISVGVDKVFDTITITAPDASGNFSVSVSGVQILTGTIVGATVTITPDAAAISSVSIIIYPSTNGGFTAELISGKTFNYTGTFVNNKTGSLTFNSDNTYLINSATPGTWSINSAGQLIMTMTNSGEIDTLTLTSVTATVQTASVTWTNPKNPNDPNSTGSAIITFTVATGGGSPANVFTTAMVSGKSFTDSSHGTVTFNANGSFISSDSTSTTKTWSINSNGQILVHNASAAGTGTATITLISGDITTGLQYSVLNTDGTTSTGTFTLDNFTVTGFTTAMISGKTATHTYDSGSTLYTFAATGNTLTATTNRVNISAVTYSGTWSIDTNGRLSITLSSAPTGASYPSLFQIISGSGNSLGVKYTHNVTPPAWEGSGINFTIN